MYIQLYIFLCICTANILHACMYVEQFPIYLAVLCDDDDDGDISVFASTITARASGKINTRPCLAGAVAVSLSLRARALFVCALHPNQEATTTHRVHGNIV